MSDQQVGIFPDVLIVHTKDAEEKIARCQGTGNWRLDKRRGANCDYVVITQNGGINRGNARIIGKIETIVESEKPGRKLIRCSEFARVDIPGVWGGWQNPVYYGTSERFQMTQENLDALPWQTPDEFLQAVAPRSAENLESVSSMHQGDQLRTVDLATAKAIIAAHFNTRPELIALVC